MKAAAAAVADQPAPLLLSMEQAAELLGVCTRMVGKLVSQGKLASVAIGRRRLINRLDLLAFIDANTGGGR